MRKITFYICIFLWTVSSLYTIAQSYQGIGARVTKGEDGSIVILEIFEGSPAQRQGLEEGDRIISIEGTPAENLSLEESVNKLQGSAGTRVHVQLADKKEVSLERGRVDPPRRMRTRIPEEEARSPSLPTREGIILSLNLEDISARETSYEVVISLKGYNPRYFRIQEKNTFLQIPKGFILEEFSSSYESLSATQTDNTVHISSSAPLPPFGPQEQLALMRFTTPSLPPTIIARFLFENDSFTSLKGIGGANILGRSIRPTDGVLHLRASTHGYRKEEGKQDILQLSLQLPETASRNEEIMAHMKILNPDNVSFNYVDIVISYEGGPVQFRDLDKGNHISTGLNVWDGPYRESFPFTEHYRNQIDTRRQRLHYRKGTSRGLQEEGTLFSFQFTPRERGELIFQFEKDTSISLNQKPYELKYKTHRIQVQ